jgi:predicted lipid carrier protein YhbT
VSEQEGWTAEDDRALVKAMTAHLAVVVSRHGAVVAVSPGDLAMLLAIAERALQGDNKEQRHD